MTEAYYMDIGKKFIKNFDNALSVQANLFSPPIARHLAKIVGEIKIKSILDFGCGNGEISKCLLTIFPEATLTALDVNDAILNKARRSLECFGERVIYVKQSVFEHNTAEPVYDLVFSSSVVQYMNDSISKLLSTLSKVIVKDGLLVLMNHHNQFSIEPSQDYKAMIKLIDVTDTFINNQNGDSNVAYKVVDAGVDFGFQCEYFEPLIINNFNSPKELFFQYIRIWADIVATVVPDQFDINDKSLLEQEIVKAKQDRRYLLGISNSIISFRMTG